ncbi:MAG: hypothetical protein KIT11_07620 [Fimbriimonadaceae bacterium]|nr:hypothetical protein [Fimbriimonadaceae bacterium]QYK56221.1 MAG: hypothetical protein KF733_01810 [Fimbriimonadaceae bacterium]
MRIWLGGVAAGLIVFGCRPAEESTIVVQPPTHSGYRAEPLDTDAELAEQLRSGAVQASAASETIEEALKFAKLVAAESPDETREAAENISDYVDSAGATVVDAGANPPVLGDVKANFVKADDERKKRIENLNDAFRDLQEALGAAKSLSEQDDRFAQLADLIQVAMDDTGDAVKAYGGQIEDADAGE